MTEEAYETLLSAIAETRLRPGTHLSQNRLAAHLGISRTPVREALMRLESEGLVQHLPDNGFVVAGISADEVHEACDLLEILDLYVYQRATHTLDADELATLLDLAHELVETADAGDTAAWKEADSRYHTIVMNAAGNRFVAQFLKQTRHRIQRFWMSKTRHGRLLSCSHDHVTLARVMADRDDARVAATVHEHIERLRRNVIDLLDSARPLLPEIDPLAGFDAGSAAPGADVGTTRAGA